MRSIYALVISLALLVTTAGIATAAPYPRSATQQQAVQTVIARALSQRGVPFSYGGGDVNGPTRGSGPQANALGLDPEGRVVGLNPVADVVGFDASGLMVYSFAGVGVKLPRSSGEQYKVGQKVTPAQALPGDLIFYGPDGTQSVALFIGNGKMVEATDAGVAVSAVRTNNMAPYLSRIIA
ncbi:hydrolase [Mycolicibacterium moriokaense]|jgi:cell wall-associated NlpC family hydrolase|uniref:Hydrolase n=1 Tax=Mycolicibacterium moriokaense TaxID=39691 RepID=A0AAD1HBR6_9MYCO|nr:NlpC/P60 family peptidoglycan-binding protein RipD [Mycolicibacterium moriokaense]MCV7038360.1 NlpC/P60 family peptidoglycan-binding protein RipD [Mycolicibacterium moriokaense]ORB13676.1 hydrolase [Mycolicibacterium moriokaense]BBX02518.1 hydrolase [Mycolicibacterium moriokaense]